MKRHVARVGRRELFWQGNGINPVLESPSPPAEPRQASRSSQPCQQLKIRAFGSALFPFFQADAVRSLALAHFLRPFSRHGGSVSSSASRADCTLCGALSGLRQPPLRIRPRGPGRPCPQGTPESGMDRKDSLLAPHRLLSPQPGPDQEQARGRCFLTMVGGNNSFNKACAAAKATPILNGQTICLSVRL